MTQTEPFTAEECRADEPEAPRPEPEQSAAPLPFSPELERSNPPPLPEPPAPPEPPHPPETPEAPVELGPIESGHIDLATPPASDAVAVVWIPPPPVHEPPPQQEPPPPPPPPIAPPTDQARDEVAPTPPAGPPQGPIPPAPPVGPDAGEPAASPGGRAEPEPEWAPWPGGEDRPAGGQPDLARPVVPAPGGSAPDGPPPPAPPPGPGAVAVAEGSRAGSGATGLHSAVGGVGGLVAGAALPGLGALGMLAATHRPTGDPRAQAGRSGAGQGMVVAGLVQGLAAVATVSGGVAAISGAAPPAGAGPVLAAVAAVNVGVGLRVAIGATRSPRADPNPIERPAAPRGGSGGGEDLARAARTMVDSYANATYNQETYIDPATQEKRRLPDWWWTSDKFDCAKFVLRTLALARDGHAPVRDGEPAHRIEVAPFGRITDVSSVSAMLAGAERLAREGKAGPLRRTDPQVGDIMFWRPPPPPPGSKVGPPGHVAIVVAVADAGRSVTYANMGQHGARLQPGVRVDALGTPTTATLASGIWTGFWTPPRQEAAR